MLKLCEASCFSIEIVHSTTFRCNPDISFRVFFHSSGKRRGQLSLLRFIGIIIGINLIVRIKQINPTVISANPESSLLILHHTDDGRITQAIRFIIFTVIGESIGGDIQFIQTFKSSHPIVTQVIFDHTTDVIAGKSILIRCMHIVCFSTVPVQSEKPVIFGTYPNILFGVFINTGYILCWEIIKPFLITVQHVQAIIHGSYI